MITNGCTPKVYPAKKYYDMITMRKKYKGWLLEYDKFEGFWKLYTPSELEQPAGFRYSEAEFSTLEHAKQFIDHYNE